MRRILLLSPPFYRRGSKTQSGCRGFLTAGTVSPVPRTEPAVKVNKGLSGMIKEEGRGCCHTLVPPAPSPSTPGPHGFLGIPPPDTHYIQSSTKLQAPSRSSWTHCPSVGKLRPIETSGLWDYAGTSPSSLGIPAGSVLSEHKHSLRDSSTSADLVTGLWAGPSKGGGCPLRREDGTDKRPFVRETPVLHSCLPWPPSPSL